MKKKIATLATMITLSMASFSAFALPTQKDVEQAIRAQNWTNAESMLLEVTKAKPNNAKAWYFLAQTEEKEGKFGSAQQDLHRAEQLDPSLNFASPGQVPLLEQRLQSELGMTQTQKISAPTYVPVHHNSETNLLTIFLLIFGFVCFIWFIFWIWRFIFTPTVVQRGNVTSYGGYGSTPVSGGGSTVIVNGGNSSTSLLETMIVADAIRESHHGYRDDDYSSRYDSAPSSNNWDSDTSSSSSSSVDLGGSSGGWDSGSSVDTGSSSDGDW